VLLSTYGTKASLAEYARVIARWEASGRRLSNPDGVSVNELPWHSSSTPSNTTGIATARRPMMSSS
jgi:hypothetical protein